MPPTPAWPCDWRNRFSGSADSELLPTDGEALSPRDGPTGRAPELARSSGRGKGGERVKITVVFIGLGIMGRPMARNLIQAGHRLIVLDRNPAPVAELAALGAEPAASPASVAEHAEVVITMLPDSPAGG